MGTLNFIEEKISECLICKSKNWKPIHSSVDANEYECNNCSNNYYFLLLDSELEKVRAFDSDELARIKNILSNKAFFEARKKVNNSPYSIYKNRLPITYRDIESFLSTDFELEISEN